MLLGFSTISMMGRARPSVPATADAGALGDVSAFVAFIPGVRAGVAAVLAVGRDHADGDDATSETLRRAIEGQARFRNGEPVRPWLMGIARHVALDARRARPAARRHGISSMPRTWWDPERHPAAMPIGVETPPRCPAA